MASAKQLAARKKSIAMVKNKKTKVGKPQKVKETQRKRNNGSKKSSNEDYIWKDKKSVKTKEYDTSESETTDSDERDRSPVSIMRLERLSRKLRRIHPPRQSSRLLRASGKRG